MVEIDLGVKRYIPHVCAYAFPGMLRLDLMPFRWISFPSEIERGGSFSQNPLLGL